jgi:hypothetical protein
MQVTEWSWAGSIPLPPVRRTTRLVPMAGHAHKLPQAASRPEFSHDVVRLLPCYIATGPISTHFRMAL